MYAFNLPSLPDMLEPRNGGMQMLNMINRDDFRSALITGVAGSGKTTISLQRLIRLTNQGKPVRFMTYQRLLAKTVTNIPNIPSPEKRISTFHKWHWDRTGEKFSTSTSPTETVLDRRILNALQKMKISVKGSNAELIIDEGQDLPEVVYKVLPKYFARVLIGADNGQKVHTEGASAETIASVLSERYQVFKEQELGQNFRNTYQIYRFARQFLPHTNLNAWNENIPERLLKYGREGDLPEIVFFSSGSEKNADLIKSITNRFSNRGSLALLCMEPDEVNRVYDLFVKHDIKATKIHNKIRPIPELEGCLITTFLSAKGLEFDNVIITQINNKDFGNWTISQQCYVACTRAKLRLMIYCDKTKLALDQKQFESDTYQIRTIGTIVDKGQEPF